MAHEIRPLKVRVG